MAEKRLAGAISASVGRIRSRILNSGPGNYISGRVTPIPKPVSVSDEEAHFRRAKLQKFRDSHPQDVDAASYSQFVHALYPLSDNLGRFSGQEASPTSVNHANLFEAYSRLPSPGVAYIKPQDFECFMAQVIHRRDFVRPNSLSLTSSYYFLSEQIINAFSKAQAARKSHLAEFWKVAGDLNVAEVPVTKNEQRQLLFMTLYRDRPDVLEMVQHAFESMNKALEKYEFYAEKLRQAHETMYSAKRVAQFREALKDDLDIDTLNMFLFTAFRHNDAKTRDHVLGEIEHFEPNRKTFQVVLEGFAYESNVGQFASYLHLLSTSHLDLVDVRMLNTLVRCLARLDMVDAAESLVGAFSADLFRPLQKDEQFLKQMTISDRDTYARHWTAYEQLQHKPVLSVYPTEDTFFPLVAAYCRSEDVSFDKIVGLLFQAEQVWGIPLTTRTYKMVFHSLATASRTIDDLRFATGKLVASHDAMSASTDSWLSAQILNVEVPANAASVIHGILQSDTTTVAPKDQGCFVKLSDELVLAVYRAFVHVLHDQPELQGQAADAHAEFKKLLAAARSEYTQGLRAAPSLSDLASRDEFTYIKKGFIIELLDVVS